MFESGELRHRRNFADDPEYLFLSRALQLNLRRGTYSVTGTAFSRYRIFSRMSSRCSETGKIPRRHDAVSHPATIMRIKPRIPTTWKEHALFGRHGSYCQNNHQRMSNYGTSRQLSGESLNFERKLKSPSRAESQLKNCRDLPWCCK